MHKNKLMAIGALTALAVAFTVGVYIGVEEHSSNVAAAQSASTSSSPTFSISVTNTGGQPSNVDMSQFWQAWDILQQNFVETHASGTIPTDQEKVYGAIEGLANAYGDPYTTFFPPQQAQIFTSDINGSFAGVGMEMDQDDSGNLIVTEPLSGSPAQKAGILAGDIITSINGTSTEGMAIDEAVALIRGPQGTVVDLGVLHLNASSTVDIKITRDIINIPEINTIARPDGVFVIQLYTFTQNSGDLVRDALRQFVQSGDTRLVLDLRGNPGGYLDQAVQIASYFLPLGQTIVTEDFEGKQQNIVNTSLGYNIFAGKKLSMAILVDQNSASASEILSGALQQHGVAKLVGTRTFGKGSVQELMDLGGGAELKVTIARWLTPNGTSISNGGLTPDINATTTQADVTAGKDPTMDAAVNWLMTQ